MNQEQAELMLTLLSEILEHVRFIAEAIKSVQNLDEGD